MTHRVSCVVVVYRAISGAAVNSIWVGRHSDLVTAAGFHADSISKAIAQMTQDGTLEYLEQGVFGAPSKLRVNGPEPISTDTRGTWATPEIEADIATWYMDGSSDGDIVNLIKAKYKITLTKDKVLGRRRNLGVSRVAIDRTAMRGSNSALRRPRVPVKTPGRDAVVRTVVPLSVIVGPVPEWGAAADELLMADRALGCSYYQIAERFGVTVRMVEGRVRQIKDDARNRTVPRASQTAPSTRGTASPKGGSSTTITGVVGWNFARLPKIAPRTKGLCAWPLTCGAVADGRFCDAHAGLLRGQRAA